MGLHRSAVVGAADDWDPDNTEVEHADDAAHEDDAAAGSDNEVAADTCCSAAGVDRNIQEEVDTKPVDSPVVGLRSREEVAEDIQGVLLLPEEVVAGDIRKEEDSSRDEAAADILFQAFLADLVVVEHQEVAEELHGALQSLVEAEDDPDDAVEQCQPQQEPL